MSKKAILKHHENFEDNIENIIKYGLDIITDKLSHKKEEKGKQEKSMLLEGLLLRSCALWESFVEHELVLLVSLDPTNLKKEKGLPQNIKLNVKLIRALLFCDRYRTYCNIEQSKSALKKLLAEEYNLFNEIRKEQKKKTTFIYKMRNYLSHYSAFSRKQLFIAYDKTFHRRRFLEPGLFLMKERGKYFENLIHNFKMMSISMKQRLK